MSNRGKKKEMQTLKVKDDLNAFSGFCVKLFNSFTVYPSDSKNKQKSGLHFWMTPHSLTNTFWISPTGLQKNQEENLLRQWNLSRQSDFQCMR